MQGNSVLALAGLANAVFRYRSSVESNSNGKEATAASFKEQKYKPIQEWIDAVADTLLVILDGNLKTIGPPLNWCQQVWSLLYNL